MPRIPIIDHDTAELPVFEPGNLLDGARRQKGLPERRVPAGCLLDMDGELLDRLVASERAALDPTWPCFHTKLYRWKTGDLEVGPSEKWRQNGAGDGPRHFRKRFRHVDPRQERVDAGRIKNPGGYRGLRAGKGI